MSNAMMSPQRMLGPRHLPLQSDPFHVSLPVRIVHEREEIGQLHAPLVALREKETAAFA